VASPEPAVGIFTTAGDGDQDQRLTTMVTATAAANGYQQRLTAAHDTRTIRANSGNARPEKRQSRVAPTTLWLLARAEISHRFLTD
jgi:hypothetical protein